MASAVLPAATFPSASPAVPALALAGLPRTCPGGRPLRDGSPPPYAREATALRSGTGTGPSTALVLLGLSAFGMNLVDGRGVAIEFAHGGRLIAAPMPIGRALRS